MTEPDLLKRVCAPVLLAGRDLLAAAGLPALLQNALDTLLDTSGLIAVAALCAALGAIDGRLRGARARAALAGACTVLAAGLGVWIAAHPSDRFDALFARWDHLAFAGSAGLALTTLAGSFRNAWLAALGVAVLLQYAGPTALAVVVALSASGMLVLHTPVRRHTGALWIVQALLVIAAYGMTFWMRGWNFAEAARVQGLLTFWMLRHISMIAVAARNGVPAPSHCAAFLTFYPGVTGLFGAPEVYAEFARRNLTRAPVLQHRRAARRMVEGVLLITAAMAVPAGLAEIETAASAPRAWAYAIAFFLRTALAVLGAWRTIDATALLYGVQLRANFSGLLTCRNPSELWWAWRGTLTNWLVQFVYMPLGANRRHQLRNIAAAFAVSFLWHALGEPFVAREFRWAYLAPVALWATINGLAVIAHVTFVRLTGGRPLGIGPPRLRAAVATALMWGLASLTPILLFHHGPATERLGGVLTALTGWR